MALLDLDWNLNRLALFLIFHKSLSKVAQPTLGAWASYEG